MLVDVVDEPGGVLAHLEEVGLLLGGLHLAAAVGAAAVLELGGGEEGLAGGAVHALVGPLVDVALVVELLEDPLDLPLVILVRGADELVVGGVHQIPDGPDVAGHPVHVGLRLHPRLLGLLLDLLAVLVGAGLEEHVVAHEPLVAGDGVRQHDLVHVADVRRGRGVSDGRSDIVRSLFHEQILLPALAGYI